MHEIETRGMRAYTTSGRCHIVDRSAEVLTQELWRAPEFSQRLAVT